MNKTYIVLKKAISSELCKFIAKEMQIFHDMHILNDPKSGQEPGLTQSWSIYSIPPFEALALELQPLVEKTIGKRLYPTYSYGRIYRFNAELTPHLDRRSSEYTLSCCIRKGFGDWELAIEDCDTKEVSIVTLEQGDVMLYQGRKHKHWRVGPFKGLEQFQIFIQYVDADGDSKDLKWDTRPVLGLPFDYAQQYVKDELEEMMKGSKNV